MDFICTLVYLKGKYPKRKYLLPQKLADASGALPTLGGFD